MGADCTTACTSPDTAGRHRVWVHCSFDEAASAITAWDELTRQHQQSHMQSDTIHLGSQTHSRSVVLTENWYFVIDALLAVANVSESGRQDCTLLKRSVKVVFTAHVVKFF
jgi:hypothetical protein